MRLIALTLTLFAGAAIAQPPAALNMQSPVPAAPVASATVFGNTGQQQYNYWVVVTYASGTVISQPAFVSQVPNTLTSQNYVNVGWNALPGAVSYDVVRLTPPAQFSGVCTACTVATGVTGTNQHDTGGALSDYTVGPASPLAASTIYVNNRDYPQPKMRKTINGIDTNVGEGFVLADQPPIVSQAVAKGLVNNWTLRTTPQSALWTGLAYSPELRRVVSVNRTAGSFGHVMTSDDGGVTWTLRTTPGDSGTWSGLTWNDSLGIFIALPFTSSITSSMTSPDGITWTLQPSQTGLTGGLWNQIATSASGVICSTAAQGAGARSTYSADGVNWTMGGVVSTTASAASVAWSSDLGLFVGALNAAASSGGGFSTSPDCATWTQHPNPVNSAVAWSRIVWSPQLHIFVATGNSGQAGQKVAVSSNGISWTSYSSTNNNANWGALAWSPQLGVFMAASQNTNDLMYSYDGVVWTAAVYPTPSRSWGRMIWIADYGWFVADDTATDASPQIMTSAPILFSAYAPNQSAGIAGNSPTQTIASGATAMGTGIVNSAACASVVSVAAPGVLGTDRITATFNGDPTSTTGFIPSTNGMLTIFTFPTAGNVNFRYCNNTGGNITPGAITLNWGVTR